MRVVGGGPALLRCLSRLVPQAQLPTVEVIVPYDSTVNTIGALGPRFPQVRFVDMGVVRTRSRPAALGVAHELYDRRTARGLTEARGDIVALLEDYGAPDTDWCHQVLAAHRLPYGVIGGAVEHEGRGAFNWAVYFLDFGRYQLPLEEQPSEYLTDVNVTYKRACLEPIRHLWSERYNEVTTHWALARQGVGLWLRPQLVVREDRGQLALRPLLRERLAWGRLFGATRVRELTPGARLIYIATSPLLPLVLLGRISRRVMARRRNRMHLLLAFPHLILLTVAWCLGETVGYLTRRES